MKANSHDSTPTTAPLATAAREPPHQLLDPQNAARPQAEESMKAVVCRMRPGSHQTPTWRGRGRRGAAGEGEARGLGPFAPGAARPAGLALRKPARGASAVGGPPGRSPDWWEREAERRGGLKTPAPRARAPLGPHRVQEVPCQEVRRAAAGVHEALPRDGGPHHPELGDRLEDCV